MTSHAGAGTVGRVAAEERGEAGRGWARCGSLRAPRGGLVRHAPIPPPALNFLCSWWRRLPPLRLPYSFAPTFDYSALNPPSLPPRYLSWRSRLVGGVKPTAARRRVSTRPPARQRSDENKISVGGVLLPVHARSPTSPPTPWRGPSPASRSRLVGRDLNAFAPSLRLSLHSRRFLRKWSGSLNSKL